MPDLSHERRLGHCATAPICGVDEAGRGPLAGPVVAAAVIMPESPPAWCARLDDSKKLNQTQRDELFARIIGELPHGIARAEVAEIDQLNILQATFLAMARAVSALPIRPTAALVDGNRPPPLGSLPVHTLIKGDGLSLSIAAASILAKVSRDRIMTALAKDWPGYGWEHNAGYPTAAHRAALRRLGVTPEHRRSFAPVSEQLSLTI